MSKKPEAARQIILDSAIEAFARKGYAGTSILEILKVTGLSKPTLYYYFESKAGLFRSILDFAFDEPYRLMRAAAAPQPCCETRLVALISALFGFCESHRSLTRLLFGTVFAAPEEIPPDSINQSKRQRNFEFVLGIVRDGQKSKELDPAQDATELAHGIYGTISHQIRMHLIAPTGRLDRRRAERVVALYLNGARNRKQP